MQGSSGAAGVLLRSAEADVSGSQAAARARPAFQHFRVLRVVACEELPASASAAKVASSSILQLVAPPFHALSLLGVEVTSVLR